MEPKMRLLISVLVMAMSIGIANANAGGHEHTGDNDRILSLVTEWFGGSYSNSAQVKAETAQNVSEEKRSMSLHQIVETFCHLLHEPVRAVTVDERSATTSAFAPWIATTAGHRASRSCRMNSSTRSDGLFSV